MLILYAGRISNSKHKSKSLIDNSVITRSWIDSCISISLCNYCARSRLSLGGIR